MNRLIVILAAGLAGAAWGDPGQKSGRDDLDAIADRVASNDWAGAAAAWRKVDLRKGDPVLTIHAAAKAVPDHPEAQALRREMATKYRLLADETAPLPAELADIAPYDVPMVAVEAIIISGLRYTVLDVITLQPDVLRAMGIVVPAVEVEIIQIDDARFCELMRLWESRYARQIDDFDAHGNRLVPMPGTVLWRERQSLIRAVESRGFDALWDAYHARLSAALARREKLGKK